MVDQAARWKVEAQKVLDVRPELESGGEPFVRIMEAASASHLGYQHAHVVNQSLAT